MSDDVDYILPNGKDVSEICTSCRAGFHASCADVFSDRLEDDEICCCDATYSATQHGIAIMKAEFEANEEAGLGDGEEPDFFDGPREVAAPKKKGNSGYIGDAAWRSPQDIGTLADPQSTGRKRAKDMFPIPQGMICEWEGLAAAGGGVAPIVGCIGYPAQDIHHGPDKNTLNNAKQSLGVGSVENVHRICSFCHNTWHAANDPFYPSAGHTDSGKERIYERDQATPFLPQFEEGREIHQHDPITRTATPRQYDLTKGKGRVGKEQAHDDDE